MKSKALVTMLGVGLLAGAALPALAAHDLASQLQMTDGYTEPATVSAPGPGAAGRPGKAADDKWLLKPLKQTDGYTELESVPASHAGATGRPGRSSDDAWLERQLRLSEGT